MSVLQLGRSLWKRLVAQEPEILLRNRYFETNPTDLTEQSALLCRPGLKKWLDVGEGPIRAVYSCPGSFSDALFVASGDELYRVDQDNSVTLIGGISGLNPLGYVSMTATARVDQLPEFLYIADGTALYIYMEDGYARGILDATAIASGDTVHIGDTYYRWTDGDVNADGKASGTLTFSGQPARNDTIHIGSDTYTFKTDPSTDLQVQIGANFWATMTNLITAINYNSTVVTAFQDSNDDDGNGVIKVAATDAGTAGNSIVFTESATNVAISGSGTLQGGTTSESPDGSSTSPWLIALGDSMDDALYNFAMALNAEGVAGTDYSTNVEPNDDVTYQGYSATTVEVRARDAGAEGNGITTVVDTGAGLSWEAATLEHGGEPVLWPIQVPNDVGVISVGFIASYVIVVITQGQGYNGRWYWIEPGETVIRPLNYATAERSPDPLYQVLVLGDQFMLLGQATTEIWYPNGGTGTDNVPFSRLSGQLYDRGTWEGTAVQLKENLFIVDSDGAVFNAAGSLQRISNPSIEEMIRTAIQAERSA